jgi:4-hydroxybenzoate polyprenyltransferase
MSKQNLEEKSTPPQTLQTRFRLYLALIRWNKPAGWLLLLWPSISALWIANHGYPGLHLTLVFVLGTILMRSAGCCINDVADKEFDRYVKRTADRPVTSGKLSSKEALAVGAVLALLAFFLVLTTNLVCVAWSFVALLVAMGYPYAKRVISMPQAILGIAFSFGIPMAFAAVLGFNLLQEESFNFGSWVIKCFECIPVMAWEMLLSNMFWVLAYDTEYAMVDRDDDLKIGIKTSAITLARYDVICVMAFYTVYILSWWLIMKVQIQSFCVDVAAIFATLQALYHYWLIRTRSRQGCFKAFKLNHWLGATLFLGIVSSYF